MLDAELAVRITAKLEQLESGLKDATAQVSGFSANAKTGFESVVSVLKALENQIQSFSGKIGNAKPLDPLQQAFQRLKVTSEAQLNEMAASARAAFETIRSSGEASLRDVANAEKGLARELESLRNLNAFGALEGDAHRTGGTMSAILSDWRVQMLALTAAYEGFHAVQAQIGAGIEFNQLVESATLGIATLITAQSQLKDAQGKTLEGQQALNAAMAIAQDQVSKIRGDGLQTLATTKQLVEAYQVMLGPALTAGITHLDDIRHIMLGIVQAAASIDPTLMNQLGQEVRAIFEGDVSRNSRVNQILQVHKEDLEQWEKEGTLVQNLLDKLTPFLDSSQRISQTWAAAVSNMQEARDNIMGLATSGLFEQLRQAMLASLSGIFNADGSISRDLKGFVDFAKLEFTQLGAALGNALQGAMEMFKQWSAYLGENRAQLDAMIGQMASIAKDTGSILADLISIGLNWLKVLGYSGEFKSLLEAVASLVHMVADGWDKIAFWTGEAAKQLGLFLKHAQDTESTDAKIEALKEKQAKLQAQIAEYGQHSYMGAEYQRELQDVNALLESELRRRSALNDAMREQAQNQKEIANAHGGNYGQLFDAATSKYQLPQGLLASVAQAESQMNPDAVSPKGATGLMQLMPGTAAQYGVTDLKDAAQSIDGGAHYLADLLKLFHGDLEKAVASYNAGQGNVLKAIGAGGALDYSKLPKPEETEPYVGKVLGGMGVKVQPKPQPVDEKGLMDQMAKEDEAVERHFYIERQANERSIQEAKRAAEEKKRIGIEQAQALDKFNKDVAGEQARLDQIGMESARDKAMAELAVDQELLNQKVRRGEVSQEQQTAILQAFEERRYQIELTYAQKQQALYEDGTVNYAQWQAKIDQLAQQHVLKRAQIETQAITRDKTIWQELSDRIEQSFSQAVTGIILGTNRLSTAYRSMLQGLLAYMSEWALKKLTLWVKTETAQTAATTTGESTRRAVQNQGFFGFLGMLGKELAEFLGLETAKTAAAAASTPAVIATNMLEAASNAAVAATGAMASVAAIPFVGWSMAPEVGAATYAQAMGFAALASAAGGFDVPSGVNPMTQLHAREMVLPEKYADVIRGMAAPEGSAGRSGGDSYQIHISALDGRSVEQIFRANGPALAKALKAQARNLAFAG